MNDKDSCLTGNSRQIQRDEKGRFVRGVSGNPEGSTVGIKRKANRVKEAFFTVFEKLGGTGALLKWAKDTKWNKKEFYKMLLQILPKELSVEGEGFEEKTYIVFRNPQAVKEEQDTKLQAR